jgi:hypothetical protein
MSGKTGVVPDQVEDNARGGRVNGAARMAAVRRSLLLAFEDAEGFDAVQHHAVEALRDDAVEV